MRRGGRVGSARVPDGGREASAGGIVAHVTTVREAEAVIGAVGVHVERRVLVGVTPLDAPRRRRADVIDHHVGEPVRSVKAREIVAKLREKKKDIEA